MLRGVIVRRRLQRWRRYSAPHLSDRSSLRRGVRGLESVDKVSLFEDGAALAFVDEHYGGTELPRVYRYFVNKRVVIATGLYHLAVVGAIEGFCVRRCFFLPRLKYIDQERAQQN